MLVVRNRPGWSGTISLHSSTLSYATFCYLLTCKMKVESFSDVWIEVRFRMLLHVLSFSFLSRISLPLHYGGP